MRRRSSSGWFRILPQHMGARRDRPLLAAVGILVLFAALVLVPPSALLTFVVERALRLHLGVGQPSTWAIASSVVAACSMSLRSRRGSDGHGRHALLAVVVSAAVLAARFGTHAGVGGRDAARLRA